MQWHGFSSLRTLDWDKQLVPLQNDLRELERFLHELRDRVGKMTRDEPIATDPRTGLPNAPLAAHARTHASVSTENTTAQLGGSDPIDVYPFDWERPHTWALTTDAVAHTITANAAQTADLVQLKSADGTTKARWTSDERLAIRDASSTALLSLKGATGADESTITALSPYIWYRSTNFDGIENATPIADNDKLPEIATNGQTRRCWYDNGSAGADIVTDSGDGTPNDPADQPLVWTTATGSETGRPSSVPNGKPVIGTLATAGTTVFGGTFGGAPEGEHYLTAYTIFIVTLGQHHISADTRWLFGSNVSADPKVPAGFAFPFYSSGSYFPLVRYDSESGTGGAGYYYFEQPSTWPSGSWHRITLRRDAATHECWVNDTQLAQHPSNPPSGTYATKPFLLMHLLKSYVVAQDAGKASSWLAEVIVFNSALSIADREIVWEYLDAKYHDGVTYDSPPAGSGSVAPLTHWKDTNGTVYGAVSNDVRFALGHATPVTRLHVIDTAEQVRVGLDTSNYLSLTVGNGGAVTYDAAGASAAHRFSDRLDLLNENALRFYESGSTNYVGFKAATSLAGDVTWTLPTADGTSNQALVTTGGAVLGWASFVDGSGTLNYIPKWTPDGNTLGDSTITDDGTTVTVGASGGLSLSSVGLIKASGYTDADGTYAVSVVPGTALTSGTGRGWFQVKDQGGTARFSVRSDGTAAFNTFTGSGGGINIGGALPSDAYASMNASATFTSAGGSIHGLSNAVTGAYYATGSSTSASQVNAFGGAFLVSPSWARNLTSQWGGGFRFAPSGIGTATITEGGGWKVFGLAGQIGAGTRTITDWYGGYIANSKDATAKPVITNARGLYLEEQTRGGTINNGLFLASATATYNAIAIRDQNSWIRSDAAASIHIGQNVQLGSASTDVITHTGRAKLRLLAGDPLAGGGQAGTRQEVAVYNDTLYLKTIGDGTDTNWTLAGVTDHGALTGLADDDHTQYVLADGSRAITGSMTFGDASTDVLTLTGRAVPRTLSSDPRANDTAGTRGEVARYESGNADALVHKVLTTGTDKGWLAVPATIMCGYSDKSIGAATSETTLMPASYTGSPTLPADFLVPGRTIRLVMTGSYKYVGNSLTLKVKLGSTVIISNTMSAATSASTVTWMLDCLLTCQSVGGSGTVRGRGLFHIWGTGVSLVGQEITQASAITVDTTAAQTIDVTGQWTGSSFGNDLTQTNTLITAHL